MARNTQLPGNGDFLRTELSRSIHNVLNRKQEALLGIVGGALLLGTAPALAQEPASQELEEVVVTGLRGSLQTAMDTKRDAIGVVDAINAEDIGKFPEANLSESLQRITGISISRRNGEGALVTARGFGAEFNMVTLNGRMMPAADAFAGGNSSTAACRPNARSISPTSPPRASARIEVYKTSKADIATGGIGATVNIKTARPLDGAARVAQLRRQGRQRHDQPHRRRHHAGSFRHLQLRQRDQTFGVGLSGSYQKRDSSSAQADENDWRIQRWVEPGQPGSMELTPGAVVTNAPAVGQLYGLPNNLVYHFSDRERERINGQLTVQFAPTESMRFTADYTYADNHLKEHRGDQGLWMIRTANAVTFDTGHEVATPTFISEDVYQSKDTSYGQELRDQTNTLNSIGFNAEFKPTDSFTLGFDIHKSKMESLPTGWNRQRRCHLRGGRRGDRYAGLRVQQQAAEVPVHRR